MDTSYTPVDVSSAAGEEGLPFPFADNSCPSTRLHDHSCLPVHFDGLEDNALVSISGFVNETGSEEAVLCCLPCQPGDRRCICYKGPELPTAVSKKQWRPGDSIRGHSEGRQASRNGRLPTWTSRLTPRPAPSKMASIPECAICLQSCVHPVCLPCRHVFCFLCMKGASWQSKRCALCRQAVPEDFLERPKLLSPEALRAAAAAGGADHAWYYGGSGGGWWQYDERTSRELEDASAKGLTSAEMLIAGTLYVADLENMVQYRRNQPARRRRMKRDAAGVAKKGVAGLRIEPEVDAAADPVVGPPLAAAAAAVPSAAAPSAAAPSAAAPERLNSADGADADGAAGRAQSSSGGVGALPSVLPLRPPTILGGHVARPPSPPPPSPSLEEALSQLGLSQGPAGEGGGASVDGGGASVDGGGASVDGGPSYECGSGSSEGEEEGEPEPAAAAAVPPRPRGVLSARQLRETRPDRTPPGGGPGGLTRGGRGQAPDGQCTGSQV
ncbi:unnamed protein product [Boreogadus saida]